MVLLLFFFLLLRCERGMESGVMSGVAFYFGRRADTVYYRACTQSISICIRVYG